MNNPERKSTDRSCTRLSHEEGWRVKQLFDSIKDQPEEKPRVPAISYCGDFGAAAGHCFVGAMWLLDHAHVFLRAIRDAHKKGQVAITDDPVLAAEQIVRALTDEIGAFGEARAKLVSTLLIDLGLCLEPDTGNWEELSIERFRLHAERAARYFSGTGFEEFVLPWAFKIEQVDPPQPIEKRLLSLRQAIPDKVRGLNISELELNNWAFFLLLVGRWKAATPMAALATEMARYPRNLDTLGWANFFEGNFQSSISLLTEAIQKHDSAKNTEAWAEVAYHKLCVLVEAHETAAARRGMEEMQTIAPDVYWTRKAKRIAALLSDPPIRATGSERRSTGLFEYDIAISFAGEDRSYADELATELRKRDVTVFYDEFEKADLWGKNLYEYLTEVYQNKARYCLIMVSKHYVAKPWPKLERQAAQARAFQDDGEYILPVRLDGTEVPGLLKTVGYLHWSKEGRDGIVQSLLRKLTASKQ